MAVFHFELFYYTPSLAAAVIFIIAFALSTGLHIYQLLRCRTWYFIPFVIGGLFEMIGYIGRAMAAKEAPNFTKNPYILQSLLLLIAPALFAASIYMILGRLIRQVGGQAQSPIRSTWLTPIFVTGDVLSFFAQGAGGGLLATAKTQDEVSTGNNIILSGLGIQVLFFMCFIAATCIFHWRFVRSSSYTDHTFQPIRYLWILYGSSILILIRNIVRIVEYVQGFDGAMEHNEVYIYIFDSLPMFLVVVLFNCYHPSRILRSYPQTKQTSLSMLDLERNPPAVQGA